VPRFLFFRPKIMPVKKTKKPLCRKAKGSGDMRDVIDVLAIVEALEQHVLGKKKMKATQVRAALALLKKTLPDLTLADKNPKAAAEKGTAHEDALKELE
jgi:hypothetical protein